jgi:hypothetical protein
MFRACLAFVFAFVLTAASGFSQTNSEKASEVPALAPKPPTTKSQDSTFAADSAKAAAKKKSKARAKADKAAAKADAKIAADSAKAAQAATAAPAANADSSKAAAPVAPASGAAAAPDTSKAAVAAPSPPAPGKDSVPAPTVEPAPPALTALEAPKRQPQDLRLFNDPPLIAKEYGFGILGSIVAGALGFYIGSGIETAIEGESQAHQGTLSFTGIRYDNYYGAFYGGATGMILGSTLTTYFVGQSDEEDGGLFMTLAGTTAAAAGAFYVAHLMGVNDDIDWKPFIPLLAIPSMGGTLGFNVSRWFSDHKREATVNKEASVWLHPPRLAWGRDAGGDRLEIRALNLTF